jgi:2-iminobutanoate/2-iminopropanoate deaminase
MNRQALLVSVLAMYVGTAAAADPPRRYVPAPAPAAGEPQLPFSEGVMAGGVFYVAGHIGMDPSTHKVGATADAEARLVMDAVKQTLSEAGLTMDDLTSVTVYCTELGLYDAFNAVYRSYFHGPFPARAFIGVNQLVRGAHFEVAGTAVKSRAADR